MAIFALGSQAAPSNAIPPEFGERAVNAAQGVGQQPISDPGKVAGILKGPGLSQQDLAMLRAQQAAGVANIGANAAQGNPVPNQLGQIGQAGPGNLNNPPIQPNQQFQAVKVPAWWLPPAPVTPVGRYANTLGLIASVGWICLNGAWGNPIFIGGCIGVVTGLANEARKIIFK